MFDMKEIIINRCANIYSRRNTGRPVENCDRIPKEGHIADYSKAESTVRLATLRYFPTQFVIHFVALDYDMTT